MNVHSSLVVDQDQTGAALYLLASPTMKVQLSGLGATIRSIQLKNSHGQWEEVTQGFDHDLSWAQNGPYFGVTVGRVANRIGNAQLEIDGQKVSLEANDGPHLLHSGPQGFHQKLWDASISEGPEGATVVFLVTSPAGESGFPGTVHVKCRVTLTKQNVLKTVYEATTDAKTPLNLTNHAYFNLGGPDHPQILDHVFWTDAAQVLENSPTHVPTGRLLNVAGTPFDFRVPKTMGRDLASVPGGYDNCYVVQPENRILPLLKEVARVQLASKGRTLKLYTDQSGFQFYSGNYLAGVTGRHDKSLLRHAAFCLESQRFPDSPNHPEWASILVSPGETYRHEFHYAFEF